MLDNKYYICLVAEYQNASSGYTEGEREVSRHSSPSEAFDAMSCFDQGCPNKFDGSNCDTWYRVEIREI